MILCLNSQQNRFCPERLLIGANELKSNIYNKYTQFTHVSATYYIRVGLQWWATILLYNVQRDKQQRRKSNSCTPDSREVAIGVLCMYTVNGNKRNHIL